MFLKLHSGLSVFLIALSFIFTTLSTASAQGGVNYKFLEVIDYANKPVANATVTVQGSCLGEVQKTNDKGQLDVGFPIGYGDCSTRTFGISKDGYYPFTDIFGVLQTIRGSTENNPTRVELLKIPTTKTEQKTIEREELKREFFTAARTRKITTIRKFLKKGFNPNLTTSDLRGIPGIKNVPIIIFAVESGDFNTVNEFLSAGVNVKKIPNILISYLDAYPYQGESEEITKRLKLYEDGFETLVKKGANVNAKGQNNRIAGDELTTLMIASYYGYSRIVKLLIGRGVSVNTKDDLALTALIHAVRSPYLESNLSVLELLLEAGADPNVVAENANPRYSSYCASPLMNAVLNRDTKTVQILIRYKANVNLGCKNGDVPIIRAASQGWSETVKVLLGAGVNVKSEVGHQALIIAKKNLSYCVEQTTYCKEVQEIVKLLEAAGAKE